MAQQTIIQVVDDLDGKPLEEVVTVRFGLDGKSYEFDTSEAHATVFYKLLDKYLEVSRRVTGPAGAKAPSQARSKEQSAAIRSWALHNGYDVSDRGRIPADIIAAFEAAH